jgi:hypothetical protein
VKIIHSKISPEFIPHSEFHTGKWLLPVSSCWYYFIKTPNEDTITNTNFLDSVDEPLKELVSFLHDKGIKTTPSCSGHHFSEKNFELIYDCLEKDMHAIKNGGLKLADIETGQIYLYRNPEYSLPWSRENFLSEVKTYQQKGIIGIKLENRDIEIKKLLRLKFDGVKIWESDSIVFIYVNGNTMGEHRGTWQEITREIKNIL